MDWGNVQVALFWFLGNAVYSLIGLLDAKIAGESVSGDKLLRSLVVAAMGAITVALLWGDKGQPSPAWVAGVTGGGAIGNFVGNKGFSILRNVITRAWR